MGKAVATGVEEDQVAALKFGALDGFAESGHFPGLPRQLQTEGLFCSVAHEAAAIETLAGGAATETVIDAQVVQGSGSETARLLGRTIDLFCCGQICAERVGADVAEILISKTAIADEKGAFFFQARRLLGALRGTTGHYHSRTHHKYAKGCCCI